VRAAATAKSVSSSVAVSGSAILDVLAGLHKQRGQTVVMVTHDPKVASYADRTVELRDGHLRGVMG